MEPPKSSTSVLMSSLADQRLLSRIGKGRYRLRWRLFELGQTFLDVTEFRMEARRMMEDLVKYWDETAHLAVLNGLRAVRRETAADPGGEDPGITRAGARLPAHASGVGKVLLAHSEWEYVAGLFEDQGMPELTPNTITPLDALDDELKRVRERGYACDHEETLVGPCCVGAPIYGPEGTVVASVSFSVPAFRFHPKKSRYTAAILDAARRISENASPTL